MSEHDGTTSNRVGLGPCNRIYPHESPPWCGPIDPMTYGGTKYYALFIDDFTRMTYIYPLKKKSSASVLAKFKEFKAEVETQKTGKLIKRLRTDGGGEYKKWMGIHFKGSGIIHEMTAPYSPDQNGVAERANRTIMERVSDYCGIQTRQKALDGTSGNGRIPQKSQSQSR